MDIMGTIGNKSIIKGKLREFTRSYLLDLEEKTKK